MEQVVAAIKAQAPQEPLDPGVAEVTYNGALAELNAGRYDKARLMFTFLAGKAPLDPRFAEGLGISFYRLGDHAKALASLGLASHLNPTSPVPVFYLAESMAALGETQAAKAMLLAVGALSGSEPRFAEIANRAKARVELLGG